MLYNLPKFAKYDPETRERLRRDLIINIKNKYMAMRKVGSGRDAKLVRANTMRTIKDDLQKFDGIKISLGSIARIIKFPLGLLGIDNLTIAEESQLKFNALHNIKVEKQVNTIKEKRLEKRQLLAAARAPSAQPAPSPQTYTGNDFWPHVAVQNDPKQCWLWDKPIKNPRLKWHERQHPIQRIVLNLVGRITLEEMNSHNIKVLTTCHNNRCCNPAHLFHIQYNYRRKNWQAQVSKLPLHIQKLINTPTKPI